MSSDALTRLQRRIVARHAALEARHASKGTRPARKGKPGVYLKTSARPDSLNDARIELDKLGKPQWRESGHIARRRAYLARITQPDNPLGLPERIYGRGFRGEPLEPMTIEQAQSELATLGPFVWGESMHTSRRRAALQRLIAPPAAQPVSYAPIESMSSDAISAELASLGTYVSGEPQARSRRRALLRKHR